MAQKKEIKFRMTSPTTMEGRKDGVIYRIFVDKTLAGTCAPACSVQAYDTKDKGRSISTTDHLNFHLGDAKAFCQQIAAGEICLNELRREFREQDAAKEREAIRRATGEAMTFRVKLETAGISYEKLLELENERERLSSMAHNILLGWEDGEGPQNG